MPRQFWFGFSAGVVLAFGLMLIFAPEVP